MRRNRRTRGLHRVLDKTYHRGKSCCSQSRTKIKFTTSLIQPAGWSALSKEILFFRGILHVRFDVASLIAESFFGRQCAVITVENKWDENRQVLNFKCYFKQFNDRQKFTWRLLSIAKFRNGYKRPCAHLTRNKQNSPE